VSENETMALDAFVLFVESGQVHPIPSLVRNRHGAFLDVHTQNALFFWLAAWDFAWNTARGAARREGRREGLEAAAKLAKQTDQDCADHESATWALEALHDRIMELIDEPRGKGHA
jgi:hypothetical protein